IDDDGFIRACNLHDAEQRVIGRLPEEFGIDGDDAVFGEPAADVCELGSRRNQMIHAQSMTFPALPTRTPGGTRDRREGQVRSKGSAGILPSCAQRFPKLVARSKAGFGNRGTRLTRSAESADKSRGLWEILKIAIDPAGLLPGPTGAPRPPSSRRKLPRMGGIWRKISSGARAWKGGVRRE